jgi:hypothetical protein
MKEVTMKQFILLVLIFLFIACDNSNTNSSQEVSNVDKALAVLSKRGFDTKGHKIYTQKIGEEKTYIVIEDDHMFSIEDLVNPKSDTRLKQYRTNNLLSSTQVQNIKVAIYQGSSTSYAVPSNWVSKTRENFTNWNNISGTKVNFSEVSYSSGSYDILVYVDDLGNGGTIARSTFPESNGDAGATVVINRNMLNSLSSSQIEFTMTHEFGHSLGFRHTNWFDRNSNGQNDGAGDNEGAGSIGAVLLAGTPSGLDESSIMKATVLNWNGFSQYDEIGLRVMYPSSTTPPPSSGIDGPSTVADGQYATFTSPTGSSYQWYYRTGSSWTAYKTTKSITFGYNGLIDVAVVVNGSDVYYKYDINFL